MLNIAKGEKSNRSVYMVTGCLIVSFKKLGPIR